MKTKKSKPKKTSKTAPKVKKKPVQKPTKKATGKVKAEVKGKVKAKTPGKPQVSLGHQVPNLELPSTQGTLFQLLQHKGKNIILYFYPKDSTPGCTIEGHQFNELRKQFAALNTEIYGISRDSVASHERFKTKECFEFELLSDKDELACKIFGVIKEKNMYGKKVLGIERSTFLIDTEGKLKAEWRGVKADGHAQEVLNAVKG